MILAWGDIDSKEDTDDAEKLDRDWPDRIVANGDFDAGARHVHRADFENDHWQPQRPHRRRMAPMLARPLGTDALPLVLAGPLGPCALPLDRPCSADKYSD
jgi:hypothetical protein